MARSARASGCPVATLTVGRRSYLIVSPKAPPPQQRRRARAARDAVGRYVSQQVRHGCRTLLSEILHGDLLSLTSRDLAMAIAESDPVAVRAARRSARYTGLAIGGVVNLLDPAIVVIGGGVAEALGPRYVTWAAEIARRQILASSAKALPIMMSQLRDDAGLLGAAMTAFAG